MLNRALLISSVALLTCAVGGAAYWYYERNKDVIAWVGDHPITQQAFEREMHYRGGNALHNLDKQALLDEMIQHKLMLNKAYELGLPDNPNIQRQIEFLLIGKVKHRFVDREREKITLSDTELEQAYQQDKARYAVPQRDRLAILMFKKKAKQSTAAQTRIQDRLKQVIELAQQQQLPEPEQGFGAQAVSHSEHQVSRYKGGEIGWFAQGENVYWEEDVLQAGFALKQVGDVSQVVETDKGYYLVRLMERKAAHERDFADVEAQVRHRLLLAKQQAVADGFKQQLQQTFVVDVNQEKLEAIQVPSQVAADKPATIPSSGLLQN